MIGALMLRPSPTKFELRLLQRLQADFPLVPRPYRQLAEELGTTEEQVLEGVQALQQSGLIRELAPVLATRRLGQASTLAALSVPPERVEEVAILINAYPEVTHNYLRDHPYNMWFTVTASSRERVAEVLAEIAAHTGLTPLDLPTRRGFKIRVVFDLLPQEVA
jgi:DNA-binding Lrp family transcriptional regulator